MAGPTVEELLRAGGQRRAPPKPPEVGAGETFINRAVGMIPGANRLTDAIAAMALEAGSSGGTRATLTPEARAELQRMGESVPEDPGIVDRYRQVRDTRAARTEAGSQQNPWAGRAGALTGFGLSVLAPLPKASGTGLGAAVKTGAGYGALQGLTEGSADLTRGEFGKAAEETLKGAAFGGAMGAGFHGAMRLGQRGVQALRNARADTLAQETEALGTEAQAAQGAAAKQAEAERKVVGQAREMNKAFDRRAAASEQRAQAQAQRSSERAQRVLERARRRQAPPDDPNTVVLEGMSGKAHQAQQTRSDKALQYRREMGEADLPTRVASAREDYIQRMPEALEDPAAARRLFMQRYLQQRYPNDPERVARLMRERVGPGGEVLPRPAAPAPAEEASRAAGGPAQPSLAEEAEAAMAARRGEVPSLPLPQEQLPLSPAAQRAPEPAASRGLDSPWLPDAQRPEAPVFAPLPVRRGSSPAFDVAGRPPPGYEQAPTRAGGGAMPPQEAPLDMLPPADPTRAVPMPNIQRSAPAAPPLPSEAPTVPGRPTFPPGTPLPAPAPRPPPTPAMANEVQDVTRLAGPEDVGPLAAERAAAREQGAVRAVGRAGYEGIRSGQNILGAALGGIGGITRELLRDPAVKARVLAAARIQVLARINPSLYARVAAQLQGGGPRQRTQEHLLARKDPEYREARQKAAEQVAGMSDQQLIELFASAGQPQ